MKTWQAETQDKNMNLGESRLKKKISDDSGNGVLIMRWQSRRDEMIVDSNYIV